MKIEWKKFQKSWGFIAVVFLASLLLISLSFADETFIASLKIKSVIRIAGQTILSSAVFLGVVKTLQYTDYFKEEINEVIYTDKYLKSLSIEALKDKWILLTNVLHSTTFPSLKNNLNTHLLNSIISSPKNYTHSHMRISFVIKPEGDGKKFFKLLEKVEMTINGQKDTQIEFCLSTFIIKEDNADDQSNVRVNTLIVDGKDLKSQIPQQKETTTPDGLKKIHIDYQYPVPHKSSFSVIKELETIHSTRLNAYWQTDFETFVEDGLTVSLYYDKDIFEVDLLAIGQTISMQQDTFEDHIVKYVCPTLIFQNDCLILIIKYK